MAKLILKYEAAVLKEIPLTQASFTIGRVPGNDLVLDNLAVSSQHARISLETGKFAVEDLNSLNGTFVNNQRIRKAVLNSGDQVLIGKHTLIFQEEGGPLPEQLEAAEQDAALMAKLEQTVVLDTRKQREMLQQAGTIGGGGVPPAGVAKVGCLTVLAGKTDQGEYVLTGKLSMIGKSPMASVKLKGWFAPDVAAVINKRESSYQIAPSGKGGAKINGQPLVGPQDLREGDLLEVAGVKLQFTYRE